MSQSVTITRTVTTSDSSTILLNTGYLKTLPGLLKILEIILGIGCAVILVPNRKDINRFHEAHDDRIPIHDLFPLLMTTTFLIGSIILLLSCVISLSTGGLISRTIYVIYINWFDHCWKAKWSDKCFSGIHLPHYCRSIIVDFICPFVGESRKLQPLPCNV